MAAEPLIIPTDDPLIRNARLALCVGAARKDADSRQLYRLRGELIELMQQYADGTDVTLDDVLALISDIMGPEWRPGPEWRLP